MTDASQEGTLTTFEQCLQHAIEGDTRCIGREHSIPCIEQAVEVTLNFLKDRGVPINALEHGRMVRIDSVTDVDQIEVFEGDSPTYPLLGEGYMVVPDSATGEAS